MKDKTLKNIDYLFLIIAFLIFLMSIFEIIILGVAFFGADEVECNLLWCTFTTERSFIKDTIIIQTHNKCFLNGYEINCNDNRTELYKQITDGNFDKKPIYKYDKEWLDVLNNTLKINKEE